MASRPLARRGVMASRLDRIARAANERAMEIAELIVQEIALSPDTPRLTGQLAASYYADRDANGDAVVKTDVRYWQFVEYGTGNHEAQPHVRPAVDRVRRVMQ